MLSGQSANKTSAALQGSLICSRDEVFASSRNLATGLPDSRTQLLRCASGCWRSCTAPASRFVRRAYLRQGSHLAASTTLALREAPASELPHLRETRVSAHMTSGAVPSPAMSAAGRTLVSSMAQCSHVAAAYGKCCVGLGKDIAPGACAKEFEALRKCFQQARKKP